MTLTFSLRSISPLRSCCLQDDFTLLNLLLYDRIGVDAEERGDHFTHFKRVKRPSAVQTQHKNIIQVQLASLRLLYNSTSITGLHRHAHSLVLRIPHENSCDVQRCRMQRARTLLHNLRIRSQHGNPFVDARPSLHN